MEAGSKWEELEIYDRIFLEVNEDFVVRGWEDTYDGAYRAVMLTGMWSVACATGCEQVWLSSSVPSEWGDLVWQAAGAWTCLQGAVTGRCGAWRSGGDFRSKGSSLWTCTGLAGGLRQVEEVTSSKVHFALKAVTEVRIFGVGVWEHWLKVLILL